MNNDQQHETVEDAARWDRLDAAMSTRAARWCYEAVTGIEHREYRQGLALTAFQESGAYARELVDAVWGQGEDAADPANVEFAWRCRALQAWGSLVDVDGHAASLVALRNVDVDRYVTILEAADAAVTWQLSSERIAR